MEKVQGKLEVFSSILLQEYIRLMTASRYSKEVNCSGVKFSVSSENYNKIMAEPLQAPLIGLQLSYDNNSEILTVRADDDFIHAYQDKNLKEVALRYAENYLYRYEDKIIITE